MTGCKMSLLQASEMKVKVAQRLQQGHPLVIIPQAVDVESKETGVGAEEKKKKKRGEKNKRENCSNIVLIPKTPTPREAPLLTMRRRGMT